MMYEIHNGSQKLRRAIDEAMSFIINYLDLDEKVWVDIEFVKCESAGGCIHLEEDDDNNQLFLVEINRKQSLDEIVATLFHEMKHVEQTATGRLDQLMWEGVDYTGTPYYDRPWEKEAYAFESRTIHEFRVVLA